MTSVRRAQPQCVLKLHIQALCITEAAQALSWAGLGCFGALDCWLLSFLRPWRLVHILLLQFRGEVRSWQVQSTACHIAHVFEVNPWGDLKTEVIVLTVAQKKKKKGGLLMCVGAISLPFFWIPSFVNSFHDVIEVFATLMHAFFSWTFDGMGWVLRCVTACSAYPFWSLPPLLLPFRLLFVFAGISTIGAANL